MTRPSRGSRRQHVGVEGQAAHRRAIDSAARQTAASATSDAAAVGPRKQCGITGEITGRGSRIAHADSHRAVYVTLRPSPMHVLLLRPVPGNERFGLGPFFRIEPLGMEYIAAALEARGHAVTLADLRFSRSLEHQLARGRPGLVGIAAMHALETDDVLALARRVRRSRPGVPIVVGGHTAAAYPGPFLDGGVDAVVLDDGERALPRVARCARARRRARRRARPGAAAIATGDVVRPPANPGRSTSTTCRCRRGTTWRRGGGSMPASRTGRRG